MTFNELYKKQDKILKKIFHHKKDIFPGARVILAGGTALARCYLHHRVSYDLDFFVSSRFSPMVIQDRLSGIGVVLKMVEVENAPMFAAQLHGTTEVGDEPLRLSIVEDTYTGMFPEKTVNDIHTETIEGLYHRKIRTITGCGAGVVSSTGRILHAGARRTARDLFDLYVLSTEVRPLMGFVREINSYGAGVPEALLISGLGNVNWLELMDEFDMLERSGKYSEIKVFDIKRYFDEILRQ